MKNTTEKTVIYGLDELDQAVALLYEQRLTCSVYTFTGTLGAGKTTLIRRLLQSFGVHEVIASPTFTYVNIYTSSQEQWLYHFDCYRIATLDEFIEAGFGEYLYAPGSWSFIEWPEIVMPLLTHNVCHVTLDYCGQDKRELRCTIITSER